MEHQSKKSLAYYGVSLAVCLSPLAVSANQMANLPSSQSYTGLIFTPNAQVVTQGNTSIAYHQGVPGKKNVADWDNWFFAFGIMPGLEVGGRIVTNSYDCHSYNNKNCGIRDLSASAKWQLPFIHQWTGFNLAIGAQDIGGAANNFESQYIVADREFESLNLRLSAGYGRSEQDLGVLNGAFAGVEWQPLSFMQLVGEYDANALNAGIKLFTPQGMLPYGAQLSMDYMIHTEHETEKDHVWGISASMPLMGYKQLTYAKPDYQTAEYQQTALAQALDDQLAEHKGASLTSLVNALKNEGFININIGYRNNKMVVALENRRYNHNQIDGVGIALAMIAAKAGEDAFVDLNAMVDKRTNTQQANTTKQQSQEIELILLVNDIPMLSVNTEAQCYRDFLATGNKCNSLSFNTLNAKTNYQATHWLFETINNGFGRSQIILSPALTHRTATEYGFFDYSLALATNLYTPLWQGAAIDVRYLLPVANSDDFDDDGIWHNSAFENEVDRALFHQAFKLPQNFISQFSAGYIMGNYWGAANETQWSSAEGRHNLGVELSKFTPIDELTNTGYRIKDQQSMLASYRYSLPEYDWQLSLQGGEYMQGDRGLRVTSSHWLGNTRVDASYLTSKAKGGSDYENFVGISFSIPLTPWRDMKPGYLQVRGIDQFTYTVQTRVGNGANYLNTGLGQSFKLQHNIERQYDNQGRMSVAYFNENIQGLRNAYLRYLKTIN